MQSPLKFQLGDLVFAKCRDSPYWAAKIILLLPEHRVYKVSFFNQNSTAYIEQSDLLLFTDDTKKAQKKSLHNKMRQSKVQNKTRKAILKGIQMAEKERISHRQPIKQQNLSLKDEKAHKEEVEQSLSNRSSKEKQLTIELSFQAMNKRKRSPTHFIDPHPSKKQKISEDQPPVHHAHQSLNKQQQEQNYNMQHIQYEIQKKFSRLKKKEKELKRLQKKNRQDMQYLRKSSSEHIDSQIHEIDFKQHEENENPTINPGKQESLVIVETIPLHQSVQRQAEEAKEINSVHLQQRPKLEQKSQEVLLEEISQQSEVLIPVLIEPRVEVLVDIKEESPHEIARVEEIIRYKQESPQEVAVIAKTEIADGSCEEIPRPERQTAPLYEYQIKQPFQQLPVIEEKQQSQQYIKKEAVNHVENAQKHQDIPVSKIQQEVLLEYEENSQPDQRSEEQHVQLKRQSVQEAGLFESESKVAACIHLRQNKEIVQSHDQPESLIAQIGSNASNQPLNEQADNEEAQSLSEISVQHKEQDDSQGNDSFYQQIDERIPIARMKEQQQSESSQEEERELNFPSRQFSQGEDEAAVHSNPPATIDKQMDIESNEQGDFQQEHQQVQKQECESFQNPLFEVIHKKLEREMDTSGLEEMFNQAFGIPDDYMAIMGNLNKTHQKLQQLPKSLLVQTLRKYTLQIVHYLDGKCDLRQNLMTMTQRQLFLSIITLDNLNISELYEIGIIDELTYLINLFETSPKKTRSGKYHAEYLMVKARMNYYTFQLGNPIKNVESQNWAPKVRGEA